MFARRFAGGMEIAMKYDDPKMEKYWNTLPPEVQCLIDEAGADISSLGMLTKLGEYYKNDSTLKKPET